MEKTYDSATLQKLQGLELSILKDFIALCDENNIKYFGVAGTGIGAIRHKGFIPWDDDIDIGMLREDYDRFIAVANEKWSDKYTVVNGDTYKNYPLMTTRWMLNTTEFVEDAVKSIQCPLGIFLDIYAFDNAADDPKKFKRQALTAWFWSKMLILRSIPFPYLGFSGVKGKIVHFFTALTHYLMCLFCISKKWLYGRAKHHSSKYRNMDTKRVAYFCDTDPYSNLFDKADVLNSHLLPFEDIQLPFPNHIEEALTYTYGDYMQLPPPEKRKNHLPYKLSFGIYEGEGNVE